MSSPAPATAALSEVRRGGSSLRSRGDGVVIELSAEQVEAVVRGAAGGGSVSVLLSGRAELSEALAPALEQLDDRRLSRSLLAGLVMLASFPADGSYLGNAQLARMLEMNPSTAHRYVSTFVAVGLLERDPDSRRYRRPR
jgi:hypothetical protein